MSQWGSSQGYNNHGYLIQRICAILSLSTLIAIVTDHTRTFYCAVWCAAYASNRAKWSSTWGASNRVKTCQHLHAAPCLRVQLPGTQHGSTSAHSVGSVLPQSHSSSPSTIPLPHSVGSNKRDFCHHDITKLLALPLTKQCPLAMIVFPMMSRLHGENCRNSKQLKVELCDYLGKYCRLLRY